MTPDERVAYVARMREPVVDETIDGIVYTSSKFPTMRGLALMGRLAIALGEQGLQLVAVRVVSLRQSFDFSNPRMFGAIVEIMRGLNDDPSLVANLLAETKCNRLRPAGNAGPMTAAAIDQHFMGELPHLLEVLQFVVAHNLAGFTLGSLSTSGSHTKSATSTDEPSA